MRLIFIGSVVDKNTLKNLPDASVAGNKMQLGFINGFKENGVDVRVISVKPHKMWKFNRSPLFVEGETMIEDDIGIDSVSYINIPALKQLDVVRKIERAIRSQIESNDTILLVYNTMSIFAAPTLKMAKKCGIKCGAIVADLPLDFKKNIFRKIEDKRQISYISKFDFLIPLTRHIQKDFAPNLPYEVIESGCEPKDCINIEPIGFNDGKKHIVFSGTLNILSGIDLILDAMEFVDKTIVLDIYGFGPDSERIKAKIKEKTNISYHGRINNDQMIRIQKAADLLVCPRLPDDFTTKYTFPSKIMEYICSGRPVLCNNLLGIPEIYSHYVTLMDENTPVAWGKMINEILINRNDFYEKKALNAKKEVFKNNNWNSLCKKIIENILRGYYG